MTAIDYQNKYPGAEMYSQPTREALSFALKGTKLGDCNPARRPEVREAIKNSVKAKWDEGAYRDRINGMLGMFGELHPNFKSENRTAAYLAEHEYVKFLSKFEDVTACRECGAREPINIHHIDENRSNFLPTNLEPLCVFHHSEKHYGSRKLPYVTIGKLFTFASAHRLPDHPGACYNWHGHEWSLEVKLRKRINRETGMVMDFSDLKSIVKEHIIDTLDHSVINDVLPNPTAENMLIWIWEKLMFDGHLKGISEISIWETPTSKATMTAKDMLSILTEDVESYFDAEVTA
jgi:6-pyruvoyltetrahydropterin/6-carboxytetrahydropterin synthase